MTKTDKLRNQLTILVLQCRETKLGEAHDTDFYVDHILKLLVEMDCGFKVEKDLPRILLYTNRYDEGKRRNMYGDEMLREAGFTGFEPIGGMADDPHIK